MYGVYEELINLRCPYCLEEGFETFDEVSYHIYGLTSDAIPPCKAMEIDDTIRFENWWSRFG